jgi:dihydrodipicolinate synthase/N-acetylneuraminate lyase
MLLEGIFLPITTPFHADGRLYPRKLESNVEHYSRTPAAGMIVLSEVGEAASITDEETRTVLASAIRTGDPEKVMLASVGRESVFATLELARFAAELGYDAIALSAPSLASDAAMQLETETYYKAVADASALPVVIVGSLDIDLIARLAQHPQIIGLIDASLTAAKVAEIKLRTADVTRDVTVTTIFAAATRRMLAASAKSGSNLGGIALLTSPALKTRTKKVGFQLLTGAAHSMLAAWQAGASGAVPRLGPAAPQACCEVWQAFRDGDQPLAEEKQDRIRTVAARMEGPRGIASIKYGADFNGYFGGRPRLPLLPPTANICAQVESELIGMRN